MHSQANKKNLKKNWILTAEAFQKLLLSFDENQDKAGLVYEDMRRFLIRYFRLNQTQNAGENADEVFNRVARGIAENGVIIDKSNPYPYFYKTAKFVLSESRKARNKLFGLDDLSASEEPFYDSEAAVIKIQERYKTENGLDILQNCFNCLSEKERTIYDKYVNVTDTDKSLHRRNLADELKKSKTALKIYVSRVRQKLLECAKNKIN